MPSEKIMPIEGIIFPSFKEKFADYRKATKSKKFQGRDASVNSSVSVGESSKQNKVSSVNSRQYSSELINCDNSVGFNINSDENAASVSTKISSNNVTNYRSATSEGKGKFVVTKEHRKDLKKLVKDMKASFEKDPKSLRGLDLSRIDFRGLQKLELKGLDLSGVNFSDCKFPDGTDFSGSELRNANFENAELIKAVFSDNDLSGARFVSAILKGAKFEDVILDKSYFGFAHLHMAEFIKIDLVKADFTNAFLYYTYFEDVDARGAIFKKAYFTYAKIIDSELHNTEFDEAKFFRCEISDTPLINSNLKNVVLDGICFLRVKFDKCVATGAKANFITRFEGCRGEPDVAWEGF